MSNALNEMQPKFSIIVPCYNEGAVIVEVITELRVYLEEHLHDGYEIIAVDDCSTDDTRQKLQSLPGIRVTHHPINRGYGAAIKSGIKQAQGEFVATFDGDGQHYPADLVALCQTVKQEEWDMAVGARSRIFHTNLWRLPGKWFLGWLANYLSKRRIPDLNSGLRLFRREVIVRYLHLCSDRFSFSTTSTLILINRGYSIGYWPIEVRARQGKSTVSLMTGYETVLLILRVICLFEPLRIFIPASIILTLVGIIHAIYPFFVLQRGLTTGSLLTIMAGILIFFFGLLADQISALRKEKYE